MTTHPIDIRKASGPVSADASTILQLLDGAVDWLATRGSTGQWGTQPASQNPRFITHASNFAAGDGLYFAYLDGRPVGALCVGDAQPYAPPATEPELYVQLLVADRSKAGMGIGARLLSHARELALDAGVNLLRVDCYRGPDGALVEYYRGQGFTATHEFTVPRESDEWPGQILERRLR
jgi:GNAT superfamily N-acetyltransferase